MKFGLSFREYNSHPQTSAIFKICPPEVGDILHFYLQSQESLDCGNVLFNAHVLQHVNIRILVGSDRFIQARA